MDEVSRRSEISGTIEAPSSKSYAQRAIAAALLSEGETKLLNMGICDDTQIALEVVAVLGASVKKVDDRTYIINGGVVDDGKGNKILSPRANAVMVGESGLSARMFTPIASLCDKPITINGSGSLLSRPMDLIIDPLQKLGVKVDANEQFLPITVTGTILGGETDVDGSVSSQFLTGLLMSLPLAKQGTTIYVSELNSIPYIDMTVDVLSKFGVEIHHNGHLEFYIEGNQNYQPQEYSVEGDWSGASCMLVAGAIAGEVTINNLNPLSKQSDKVLIDVLSRVGAEVVTTPSSVTVRRRKLKAFEFDATHCPDLFPALVALAANCKGRSVIYGTDRLKHKESDREMTLKEEFGKMGIKINTSKANQMRITGGEIKSATVESHNDHRIAMSTAVAALRSSGEVIIQGAESVSKSYPNFWRDLNSLRV